jgi:hypothetical protein
MTSKSRNRITKSAEESPRPRVSEERVKSDQRARNSGHAAATSRSCEHQEPPRRTESSLRSESGIKRVTQNT